MTFLLSEDAALRAMLLGMTVTDQKSDASGTATRSVGVWFGQPDEQIRQQEYPYLTIDMIDINEDFTRSMRGKAKPAYIADPSTIGDADYDSTTNDWDIDYPVPVNIDYQITTYARQPRHDREILAQMLYTKIPFRFGILQPDDNTVRRLDLLDDSKRDISDAGKRLFVNAFTVRVSSEIVQGQLNEMYKVLQANVTGTTGEFVQGSTANPYQAIIPFTITQP